MDPLRHTNKTRVLRSRLLRGSLALIVGSVLATGAISQSSSEPPQANSAAPPQSSASNLPELSTHDEIPTFQVKVNLVELRVVVRDAKGNAIGNLKQEDFQIFDDKNLQTITKFRVEQSNAASSPQATSPTSPAGGTPWAVHDHFIAFLFDDLNASAEDLIQARNAAERRVSSLRPGESVAIFTTSGQGNQDFASDQDKLRAALTMLKPRPPGGRGLNDCPPIDYYLASQVQTYQNRQAFEVVLQEVIACQFDGNTNPALLPAQEAATHSAVDRIVLAGDAQLQTTLHTLGDVVRRVSALPGQRTVVFLSPGFVLPQQQASLTDILNRAIREGVVINTLDVKGVFTQSVTGTDISHNAYGTSVFGPAILHYETESDQAQSDTMMQIANATGGTFFHNRNDLSTGVEKLSAAPEFSYLLGFSPKNLKNDGKFHSLKVELKPGTGLTLQARRGYYAPAPGGANREAERELADAVFSQDEIHELPLHMQTQFFKSSEASAHLSVLVHVDVRRMAFHKSDGRNMNELTIVAALFDRNANFISAKSKTVQMHIKDETLSKLNSGITLKSEFDVNPGSYVVRVVARDEQGKLASENGDVEIP